VSTRRLFVLSSGLALVVAQPIGYGQPTTIKRRVGIVSFLSAATATDLIAAFTAEMRDIGWIDGRNIEYRFTYAEGDASRLDQRVSELIADRVEVIVATSPAGARAAQRATRTIPIVMVSVSDAVHNGFVASLSKPGGNITGTTNQQEDLVGKLIETLHEVAPEAWRVAILINESNPSHAVLWTAAQNACAALSLDALRVVASAPSQFGTAVERIIQQRCQAVVVVRDALYFDERTTLQRLLERTRLPVAYGLREHVVAGGLLSYGSDVGSDYRHAALYVDRILKGTKPSDLPIEQPIKFQLVINLKTAKTLGILVPQPLLLRADEVIQ
jgi:putative ABC transport system substrate-binding protein